MSEKKKQESGGSLPDNVISLAERRSSKREKSPEVEKEPSSSFSESPTQIQTSSPSSGLKAQAALIGTIVLVVTILNQNLWVQQEQTTELSSRVSQDSGLRGPASLPSAQRGLEPSLSQRDAELERQLVGQLADPAGRGPASLGRAPSLEQRLRYELLENKYSLSLRDGKLYNIRYVPSFGLTESPNYIHDREQFLLDFKALLPAEFFEPVPLGREIASEASGMSETYVLLGEDGVPSGRVIFALDQYGRLLEMTVETR